MVTKFRSGEWLGAIPLWLAVIIQEKAPWIFEDKDEYLKYKPLFEALDEEARPKAAFQQLKRIFAWHR